jgi:hypothetical protein
MRAILWLVFILGVGGTGLGGFGITLALRRSTGAASEFDAFSMLLFTNLIGGGLLLCAVAGGLGAVIDGLGRLESVARQAAARQATPLAAQPADPRGLDRLKARPLVS